MLGSQQSDLNKQGVATVAKGVCGASKKPVAGQVVTAMGKTWRPEHFICTHCQEEIGSRNFSEQDGRPCCEKDYHNLFSLRCYYCSGPTLDKVVAALDRTWHLEHFFCAQCGAFSGPEGLHEKDGKAYCCKDYFDMFAPKGGGGAQTILENNISALDTLWLPEYFVCRDCFMPVINGSFFKHDGQPYCEPLCSCPSSLSTSSGAYCAVAARSPSRAAASPPWPRSSTWSTLSVPSASNSSTRAPSRSRTTSLTVRTASSGSSARRPHPFLALPSPAQPPNCYWDPEARGWRGKSDRNWNHILGCCRMA